MLIKPRPKRKMPKKEIHFMGLLANVDSTISKLYLDHGFTVEAISLNEGVDLISDLEGIPALEVHLKLLGESCLNSDEEKLYFVHNFFESRESGIKWTNAQANFENNIVQGYLIPVFQLMRLFKEGNICMPIRYYYVMDGGTPKSFHRAATYLHIAESPKYTLEDSEILDLNDFIQNTKLPFKRPFLQLAFENFELSYQTPKHLSFLSLMISLEVLFHPNNEGELTYRISRNTATLLGKDKKKTESKEIFKKVKTLYSKRSAIVHTGKSDINDDDLLELRHYVRDSIKEITKMDKRKNDLLDILNSSGFGERPWTKNGANEEE